MTSTRWIAVPAGGSGRPLTTTPCAGNVLQDAAQFAEEMVVVVGVGVEIRPPGLDHDLAQQPGRGELVQRVVDRRQRHRDFGAERLAVQLLGRYMPLAAVEQQARERQALPRRPQTGGAQALQQVGRSAWRFHAQDIGVPVPDTNRAI